MKIETDSCIKLISYPDSRNDEFFDVLEITDDAGSTIKLNVDQYQHIVSAVGLIYPGWNDV